ncbi:MAG: Clp protease N-terminal domain-containing protein [Candidatus Staskawiczbacteria bacterium]
MRQCTYGEGSRIEENAPWTTNAQMVLVEGREIAAELRSDKCGTEHLLLALLRIGGFSVKALVDSGFAPAIISREVMSLCSPPRQARRLGRVWQGGGTSAAMLLHGTRGR